LHSLATICFQTIEEMRALSIDQVRVWAMSTAGLDVKDASFIDEHRIDGESLLKLTKKDLIEARVPLGPVIKLMDALDAFRPAAPKASNSPYVRAYSALMRVLHTRACLPVGNSGIS